MSEYVYFSYAAPSVTSSCFVTAVDALHVQGLLAEIVVLVDRLRGGVGRRCEVHFAVRLGPDVRAVEAQALVDVTLPRDAEQQLRSFHFDCHG
jgi:hypothetical protein